MGAFDALRRVLLPPRDAEMYALLTQMAETLLAGSGKILELLGDANTPRLHRLAAEVKQLETECDGVLRQTIVQLEISQQPPFDRDEITHLIRSMDDIMDWMDRFANRFALYRPAIDDAGIEQLKELGAVVHSTCREVLAAVNCLHRRRREVDNHCVAIHEMETQADEIHHAALATGFNDVETRFMQVAEGFGGLATACGGASLVLPPTGDLARCEEMARAVYGIQRAMFRFANLRELLKALERASDAGDAVAATLKRMVISNV